MPPRVAVVIVNANAGEHLARALECVERQTVAPARTIVVDNASTDDSLNGVERFAGADVIRLPHNLGFAAANNLAVGLASDCEWIALLNPDAFPEPDWLERLLDAAADEPRYAVLGSRLVLDSDPARLDGTGDVLHVSGLAFRRDHGAPAAVLRGREEVFSACAAAALYRRDAFVSVGGFDERFFCYYEDTDLAFRLRLRGHRCLHVDDAVVRHVGSSASGRTSDFTLYHQYRNQVWTYLKNMPAPLLALYLPQHLLVTALQLAAYGVRGRAGVIARAKVDALRGLPRVLRDRRRVQRRRAVGSREILRVLSRGRAGYGTAAARFRHAGPTRAPRRPAARA